MAMAEVSIVPLGIGKTGVSEYVAGAIEELKKTGLKFRLTPMGTVIEGELDEVLAVIRRMHETPFQKGVKRVYTVIKLDDRRDKESTIDSKVKAVEESYKDRVEGASSKGLKNRVEVAKGRKCRGEGERAKE
jgi:uncharacterized protein (TIGR00106 family)